MSDLVKLGTLAVAGWAAWTLSRATVPTDEVTEDPKQLRNPGVRARAP